MWRTRLTSFPVIAQALWRQTERAVYQGLLPGYVLVEESSQVLRGRLRESAQLHAHHGLPLPLEIRHDEFTTDIPENQILRTACERMLSVPRVDPESQRMLRRLLRDFGDVTVIPRGSTSAFGEPARLNAGYHATLRIASLVLDATSVEHEAGNVAVNGFLLDMPLLFEQFVTVALREAITASFRRTRRVRSATTWTRLVRCRSGRNIVWKVGGTTAAVIDAKYKAEKPAGYPNADLYQLLAYCTILGLPVGHLVYARGNASPARHVVLPSRRRDHLPRHRPQPATGRDSRRGPQAGSSHRRLKSEHHGTLLIGPRDCYSRRSRGRIAVNYLEQSKYLFCMSQLV